MLFAMFFGAGNLIFPPQLGVEAGTAYAPAMAGFLSTAVLLPALAVIAVSVSGNGIVDIASRAGKIFGLVFSIAVYLSIGALYAIPRTANVAFETGVAGLAGTTSAWALFAFTAAFFAVSLWLSLRKGGIVDSLGRWLTPALLILILALVVVGAMTLNAEPGAPTEKWAESPYTAGFLEGYLTMDSLAALVFGIVVIDSLRSRGIRKQRQVVTSSILSGVVAVVLLGVVYLGLGRLGQGIEGEYTNGALLLSDAANQSFGAAGAWVFALIVLLACLTTAVGLIASTAAFFSSLTPRIGFRAWAVGFTLAGLLMSNLGLETIIGIAIPLNVFLYPMAVALVFLTLLQAALPFKLTWSYRIPVGVAAVFALLDLARALGFEPSETMPILGDLPLYEQSLSWVIPTAIALVVTICCAYPLSRPDFKAGKLLMGLCLFTMYFSGGIIPTFLWIRDLHMLDTIWAIVLPTSLSVYNMIVMRTYFATSIPGDLREAAQLDGCGDFRFLYSIVLPLSGPILAVIALYYAVALWNGYFNAMLYLRTKTKLPLTMFLRDILVLNQMTGLDAGLDMEQMARAEERAQIMKYSLIIVGSLPMMLIYPFVQKYFVKGVMIGAVKG